ncbi:hypothetical protein CAPTEDRAFT_211241 [Capitella teleta]|uniref:G-protein coupled receptors family 1 profile domain-containing protein n=1 Tax=Capitella teleta TaxID=283909 RepID=R7UR62_CAPTE|nr:hypothetical protein CAPTEDRAFT_211241 [Capitella teleta]|eukprot:ELU08578.1 hypothetical protein CAPTEDRAFT_211241 [Capitella teleta]
MDSTTNVDSTTASAATAVNPGPCLLYYFILATLVGGITIILGLLGNALSLSILGKQRKTSSTIQALCLLAVGDSFVLIACLPVPVAGVLGMIYGLKGSHSVGVLASVYTFEVARIFNQVSTLLTVILMWQRYVAVCLPHKAKQLCTVRMVNTVSACCSVAACLFYLPNFFLYSLRTSSDGGLYPVSHSLVHNAYFQTIHSLVLTYFVSYIIPPTKRVLMWVYDPFTRNVACGGELQYFAFMPHIALMLNSSANFSVYILFARGFRRKLLAILTRRNAVAPTESNSNTNPGANTNHIDSMASTRSCKAARDKASTEAKSSKARTPTGPNFNGAEAVDPRSRKA